VTRDAALDDLLELIAKIIVDENLALRTTPAPTHQ
jgi:hypothetical protein